MNLKKKYRYIAGTVVFLILFFTITGFILKGEKKAILFEVKKGYTFHTVADHLRKKNIIRSRFLFILLSRISGSARSLKVGFYNINGRDGMFKIIRILTQGKTASRVITVPEGCNMYQIAEILEQKKILSAEEFLSAARNRSLLNQFKLKQDTAEGFLYPETYFLPYHYKAIDIVRLMIQTFFDNITEKYLRKIRQKYSSLEQAITLASLVEWEAREDFERAIIAGVFINRLKNNVKLDSCATVLYALRKHKSRLLYKDLKVNSAFNTYIYKGLPPTPICNPSERSILAVIYPAKVDYMYFVSMKNERHYFSTSYSEHLKAYKYYIKEN